jgi:hypothetical protein
VPGSGVGVNEDYYVDTDNGDIYQKIDGEWELIGSMAGVEGPPGPTGPESEKEFIATWAGTIPAVAGHFFTWRVPKVDGVDKTFDLESLFARVEELPAGVVQFRVDKSPGGGAFTPTTVDSVSLSGEYEEENTSVSSTVTSGQLLRLWFVQVGGEGQFHVQLSGSEVV